MKYKPSFFKTGHRGCRGLFPENTINGFIESLKLGVNAIELDIVVSKDSKLVVSHEPYMNHEICLLPSGNKIQKSEELNYNLFQMTYHEIKTFDCGSKPHPRFPQQHHEPAYKPLLSEVIEAIEDYCTKNNLPPILYDIELKSEKEVYNSFQPEPAVFAEMVAQFIQSSSISNRTIIRSFDPNPLKYLHQHFPILPLAYIVENNLSVEENLNELGFVPFMYSPDYRLVSKSDMQFLKEKNCLVVPWTVNTLDEMNNLIQLGVDGIITDYPNLFKSLSN